MALAIAGVVARPLNEMGKCLFGALKRQIDYVASYNANIKKLRCQVSRLKQKQEDVLTFVEEAGRRMDVLFEEVKNWLQNTEKTIKEDMRIFEEEVNANKTCLKGLCPDLISRLKLSKKAVGMLEAINSLLEQNFSAASIAHPPPPPHVELMRAASIIDLPSRDKVMKDVMEALGNDSIRSIAVHGMGGIGKTTLTDKINNQLHENQLFKKVVKVVVSKNPDLNIIQEDIAARLDLNIKGEPLTAVRANKLFERLKKEESVLIILDDLWEKINVVAIGIPNGSEHIGCKIMLTTRDFNICNQMKIQKIIKLEPLSEDESWDIFKTKAGDVVQFSNLKPIAQEIVRRCKGSPLAIVTLGSTLTAVEEEYVWKDALKVLKNPNRSDLQGIMPEVVESISFSYDHLHCREIKLCFLFCCLFPEDYNIDLLELRDYGVGEGFLSVNETLEDASNKLLSFVKKLKDCGLLLEGDDAGKHIVKMHDVVRDVAIAIGSDDENGFSVNVGRRLRSLQETEKLKGYKRMSFMKNENLVFSDPPQECPQLRSLLIKENTNASVSNEESCFEGMKLLVVLDVSMRYQIYSFQQKFATLSSLRCLSNLRTLYLVGCDLSNKVSLFGGLRKLEILRLCGSEIGRLPEEIGNLSNLMCLDLTDATLSIVAPNVISRLSNLEELYMLNGFRDWDQVGRGDEHNASLAEVESLNHLSILRICIGVAKPHEMQFNWWNNLKEFHVIMNSSGRVIPRRPSLSYDSGSSCNILEISGVALVDKLLSIPRVPPLSYDSGSSSNMLEISSALNLLEHCVYELLSIQKVLKSLECAGIIWGSLKHVEKLVVEKCDDLKYLISTEESNMDSLGELKDLNLESLPRMKEIFHGPTPSTTFFAHLRCLHIERCDQIKKVFSSNLLLDAKRLQNLENFDVQNCDELEEVFNTEESSGEKPSSPMNMMQVSRPMKLNLNRLPKLTSIWKGVVPIGSLRHLKGLALRSCDSLESLSSYSSAVALESVESILIGNCYGMKKLIASKMEKEEGERGATSSYSCSSNFTISPPPPTFPNLQILDIFMCENLKSLFSFTMARNLQQLRELGVRWCENLEVIVEEEEEEEEVEHEYFLPRLHQLELVDCQNLRSIIQGNLAISCPKIITVIDCPNLKKLPLQPQIASSLETFEGTMV